MRVFGMARNRGDHFYKSELPEVRIKFALRAILACKNSPHNNNMSSKWQRNETSSQPVCSSDQVFELSVLELSRFYCISFFRRPKPNRDGPDVFTGRSDLHRGHHCVHGSGGCLGNLSQRTSLQETQQSAGTTVFDWQRIQPDHVPTRRMVGGRLLQSHRNLSDRGI